MRNRKFFLSLLGAGAMALQVTGAGVLLGCSSTQPAMDSSDSRTMAPSSNATTDAATPTAEPRPAQVGNGSASAAMDETIARARAERDRARAALDQNFVAEAEATAENALDRYRGRAGSSSELSAIVEDLDQILNEARRLSGGATTQNLADQDASEASNQSYMQEARTAYQRGMAAFDAGQWDDARRHFERVRMIYRFAPNADEVADEYADRIPDLINEASERAELERTQEMNEIREIARQRAMLENDMIERRQQEDVQALWGDALFNMQLKRYETAERLAETILARDPNFTAAREMLNDIKALRLRYMREQNASRKQEMYRRLWAEWYESKIPQTETYRFPTDATWRRVTERAENQYRAADESPEIVSVKNRLATQRIDLQADRESLAEVLRDIAEQTNLTISPSGPQIERDLEREQVSSRNLRSITVRDALRGLLSDAGLTYVIREGGFILITDEDGDEQSAEMRLRVYDVRDLSVPISDFPGFRMTLEGDSNNSGGSSLPPQIERQVQVEEGDLQYLIEEYVDPDGEFFGAAGAAIIEQYGQLYVRQTPEVHDEIVEFLESLRASTGVVITIEARFITVDDMFLSDFGIDWRGLGGQSPGNTVLLDDVSVNEPDVSGGTVDNGANSVPPGAAVAGLFFNDGTPGTNSDIRGRFENIFDSSLGNLLRQTGGLGLQYTIFIDDDKQFQLVLNALQKSRHATILTAPRLSAFNGQRANLTIINQVSYIQDFQITTAISAAIADPIVDTIADGLVLDVRPTVSNDRRFVTIEMQPSVATLVRPIPTFTTTLGGAGSTPVTIQLPELILQALQTTVMCPDGGLVVVGGLKMIRDVDRESTTPLLGDIPIIGTLFRRKGRSLENRSMIVIVKATITDLRETDRMRR